MTFVGIGALRVNSKFADETHKHSISSSMTSLSTNDTKVQ